MSRPLASKYTSTEVTDPRANNPFEHYLIGALTIVKSRPRRSSILRSKRSPPTARPAGKGGGLRPPPFPVGFATEGPVDFYQSAPEVVTFSNGDRRLPPKNPRDRVGGKPPTLSVCFLEGDARLDIKDRRFPRPALKHKSCWTFRRARRY
jgi:hypothetical protein